MYDSPPERAATNSPSIAILAELLAMVHGNQDPGARRSAIVADARAITADVTQGETLP